MGFDRVGLMKKVIVASVIFVLIDLIIRLYGNAEIHALLMYFRFIPFIVGIKVMRLEYKQYQKIYDAFWVLLYVHLFLALSPMFFRFDYLFNYTQIAVRLSVLVVGIVYFYILLKEIKSDEHLVYTKQFLQLGMIIFGLEILFDLLTILFSNIHLYSVHGFYFLEYVMYGFLAYVIYKEQEEGDDPLITLASIFSYSKSVEAQHEFDEELMRTNLDETHQKMVSNVNVVYYAMFGISLIIVFLIKQFLPSALLIGYVTFFVGIAIIILLLLYLKGIIRKPEGFNFLYTNYKFDMMYMFGFLFYFIIMNAAFNIRLAPIASFYVVGFPYIIVYLFRKKTSGFHLELTKLLIYTMFGIANIMAIVLTILGAINVTLVV